MFCICVLARILTLGLILWPVVVVCSEVLFGMLGAFFFGLHWLRVHMCVGALGPCLVARISVSHVSWCSLVEAPCSISLFQFTFSSTCGEYQCFWCCSLEPHFQCQIPGVGASQGQALLLSLRCGVLSGSIAHNSLHLVSMHGETCTARPHHNHNNHNNHNMDSHTQPQQQHNNTREISTRLAILLRRYDLTHPPPTTNDSQPDHH